MSAVAVAVAVAVAAAAAVVVAAVEQTFVGIASPLQFSDCWGTVADAVVVEPE